MSVYKPPPPEGSTYLYVNKVGIPINQYTEISITTDYYGNVIIRGCGIYYEYTKTNTNKETKKVSIKPTEEGLITVSAGTRTHYIYPSGNETSEPDPVPPEEEAEPPDRVTPQSCQVNSDCPAGQICVNGQCVPDETTPKPEPIDDIPPEDKPPEPDPPSVPTPPDPKPPYTPPVVPPDYSQIIFIIAILIFVIIAIIFLTRK